MHSLSHYGLLAWAFALFTPCYVRGKKRGITENPSNANMDIWAVCEKRGTIKLFQIPILKPLLYINSFYEYLGSFSTQYNFSAEMNWQELIDFCLVGKNSICFRFQKKPQLVWAFESIVIVAAAFVDVDVVVDNLDGASDVVYSCRCSWYSCCSSCRCCWCYFWCCCVCFWSILKADVFVIVVWDLCPSILRMHCCFCWNWCRSVTAVM